MTAVLEGEVTDLKVERTGFIIPASLAADPRRLHLDSPPARLNWPGGVPEARQAEDGIWREKMPAHATIPSHPSHAIRAPRAGTAKPTRRYLCTMFADDRNAGALLAWLVSWSRHAKLRRRGEHGLWSAFTRDHILAGTGLSLKQYKRAMPILVERGAVHFRVGGFAGRKAIFTRPTGALMRYLGEVETKQQARSWLERNPPLGTDGGTDGGTDTGTDPIHSTLSSLSTHPTRGLPSCDGEGKGRANGDEPDPGRTPPTRLPPRIRTRARPAPGTAPTDLASMVAGVKARGLDPAAERSALLALMPRVGGVPGAKLRHPADMHPERWQGWSAALHVERYTLYREYAQNWTKAHPGEARLGTRLRFTDEELGVTPSHRAMLDRSTSEPMPAYREPTPEEQRRHLERWHEATGTKEA